LPFYTIFGCEKADSQHILLQYEHISLLTPYMSLSIESTHIQLFFAANRLFLAQLTKEIRPFFSFRKCSPKTFIHNGVMGITLHSVSTQRANTASSDTLNSNISATN